MTTKLAKLALIAISVLSVSAQAHAVEVQARTSIPYTSAVNGSSIGTGNITATNTTQNVPTSSTGSDPFSKAASAVFTTDSLGSIAGAIGSGASSGTVIQGIIGTALGSLGGSSLSPAAAAAKKEEIISKAEPTTFAGWKCIKEGTCKPELCKELIANADAKSDMESEETNEIIVTASRTPTANVLACTDLLSANITDGITQLFKSNAVQQYAQKFFGISGQGIKISISSSPLAAPLNEFASAFANEMMNQVFGALGLGSGGTNFGQAAAKNCQKQKLAYEKASACMTKVRSGNFAGTTEKDCLDRAGIESLMTGGRTAINGIAGTI